MIRRRFAHLGSALMALGILAGGCFLSATPPNEEGPPGTSDDDDDGGNGDDDDGGGISTPSNTPPPPSGEDAVGSEIDGEVQDFSAAVESLEIEGALLFRGRKNAGDSTRDVLSIQIPASGGLAFTTVNADCTMAMTEVRYLDADGEEFAATIDDGDCAIAVETGRRWTGAFEATVTAVTGSGSHQITNGIFEAPVPESMAWGDW